MSHGREQALAGLQERPYRRAGRQHAGHVAAARRHVVARSGHADRPRARPRARFDVCTMASPPNGPGLHVALLTGAGAFRLRSRAAPWRTWGSRGEWECLYLVARPREGTVACSCCGRGHIATRASSCAAAATVSWRSCATAAWTAARRRSCARAATSPPGASSPSPSRRARSSRRTTAALSSPSIESRGAPVETRRGEACVLCVRTRARRGALLDPQMSLRCN